MSKNTQPCSYMPNQAYEYALSNHTKPSFDLNYYQKIACGNAKEAYYFALKIPLADIEYCQEYSCKTPIYAYWFAKDIPGANIEYCQRYTCYNLSYAYKFAKNIPGADLQYCRKACEHDPYWLDLFDKMIINKAMS